MSQNDELMYAVISRIENGESKKDLAEELNISYSTVMRWYREYETAKEAGTLDQLLNVDKLILATANVVAQGPMQEEIEQGVKEFKGKLGALEKLQNNFILTAEAINSQIKSRVMSVESTSELCELAETLCTLQNAFFNKNTTQVNVQNNYGAEGGSKYGGLLSDKPVN